jgi:hypothetical protein
MIRKFWNSNLGDFLGAKSANDHARQELVAETGKIKSAPASWRQPTSLN